jgi:eukaryotic-like serine/threonine-protein kinase
MSEGLPRSDVEVPESVTDPTLGRTIAGKFAIQRRLGAGAMGVVYLARQLALDKVVAIKVLHRELALEQGFVERFRREARAASRLDHPNSIRVFDFGAEPDGLLYIAMEYVEGRDLFAVIAEHGPQPATTIVDLLSQVLAAVAVAHDLGVLHRDLKPENIMIVRGKGDDGQPVDIVKVCDFGIAKIAETDVQPAQQENARRHTTKGMVVGTPEYMSPEQARGGALDGRSDLYAIGVILYELLTGRLPFQGETPIGTVLKHISDAPAPPSSRAPNVDLRLEAICMKALAKAPSDRFQDAREMRLALRSSSSPAPAVSTQQAGGLLPLAEATAAPRVHDENKETLAGLTPLHATQPSKRGRTWLVTGVALGVGSLVVLGLRAGSRPALPSNTPTASAMAVAATAIVDRDPAPHPVDSVAAAEPLAGLAPATDALQVTDHDLRVTDHEKKPRRRRAEGSVPAPPEPSATQPPQVAVSEPATPPGPPPAIEAPPPVTPPPPPPTAVAPATPPPTEPPAPAYDVAAAHVEIGQAVGTVGVTSSSMTRAVSEASAQLTGCYRSALPRLAAPNEGRAMLHVETDGAGVITNAHLTSPMDASVGRCVASAIQGRRVSNVDTGSASAEVPLVFRAH